MQNSCGFNDFADFYDRSLCSVLLLGSIRKDQKVRAQAALFGFVLFFFLGLYVGSAAHNIFMFNKV